MGLSVLHMVPPESDDFLVKLRREHGEALLRYLRAAVRNREDAEDLAQEVYARIHRLRRPSPIDHPRAWLLKIAARAVATHFLRARRSPTIPWPPEADEIPDERPLPEAHGIGHDAIRHLQDILLELPARQHLVFLHRHIYGASREDVAAQLGITLNTFDQHLWKAVTYCLERLKALGLKGNQGGDKP